MTDLKHLRELCDAATDGEWFAPTPASPTPFVTDGINEFDICDLYHKADDGRIYTKENAEANARFIAATDPQTVRALIDEIEKYRAALEEIDHFTGSLWPQNETVTAMAQIAKQALGENI